MPSKQPANDEPEATMECPWENNVEYTMIRQLVAETEEAKLRRCVTEMLYGLHTNNEEMLLIAAAALMHK